MSVRKPFVLFVVLAVYILAQFGWWAYLLYEQGSLLKGLEAGEAGAHVRRYSLGMILSEGGVFIAIVCALLFLAYRAYKRELDLVRAKDNFLMAVTHELRTPIAGMRLNLQTLERKDLDDTKGRIVLRNAIADTERLQALSDRILLAAQSDEEIIARTAEVCDLSQLTEEICARARTEIAPDHKLTLDIATGVKGFLDPTAFRSILQNLIQNAANYAPKESNIGVTLRALNGDSSLIITDEGAGIPDSEKERVFERFFRAGNENTRKTKGTGLGLYIVKRFAERFGGEVLLTDNKPAGARFEVRLPARPTT